MDLTTPTDHASAYEWAAVLMAHGFIGLVMVASLAWITGRLRVSFWIISAGYLILWEGGVQRFGAGGTDALVDTFAIMAGGLIGLAAWTRRGAAVAASVALMVWVLTWGVRLRK